LIKLGVSLYALSPDSSIDQKIIFAHQFSALLLLLLVIDG
jgi:hypothetical protein